MSTNRSTSPAARLAAALALGASLFVRPLGSQTPPASAPAPAPAPTREPSVATTTPAHPSPAIAEAVAQLAHTIAGYGGQLGVAVMDVDSGELLATANDRRPLNPASNAKLFTAAAALKELRGSRRFETGLYGQRKGANVAQLVLRGEGDPSLRTEDLWELAQRLKEEGIRRVDGDVLVDQRFFDDQFVPPAFEQQPNEWAYFRAPVSAVALNGNTVTMAVRPGGKDGPALVGFDPPGFVDVDGTVKTSERGSAQNVTLQLSPAGQKLSAKIGGGIPDGAKTIRFTRRVDDPRLLAGYALKAVLLASGIQVAGDVKAGGEGVKGALAVHRSRPLSELLYELGKMSDNFYAEMIFKSLASEKKRPAKSADGAEVVARYLQSIGAFEDGTLIKNGSGLFDANRVTALGTAKLLRAAWRDSAIAPEYVAQLAVGGVDGTLHGRFRKWKAQRAVRAKTGTLESAAALSGYVLGPPGKGPVAFSILVNGIPGKVSGARAAMDKCVEAILRQQWGAKSGG